MKIPPTRHAYHIIKKIILTEDNNKQTGSIHDRMEPGPPAEEALGPNHWTTREFPS